MSRKRVLQRSDRQGEVARRRLRPLCDISTLGVGLNTVTMVQERVAVASCVARSGNLLDALREPVAWTAVVMADLLGE